MTNRIVVTICLLLANAVGAQVVDAPLQTPAGFDTVDPWKASALVIDRPVLFATGVFIYAPGENPSYSYVIDAPPGWFVPRDYAAKMGDEALKVAVAADRIVADGLVAQLQIKSLKEELARQRAVYKAPSPWPWLVGGIVGGALIGGLAVSFLSQR